MNEIQNLENNSELSLEKKTKRIFVWLSINTL